jgi:diguanylate cyclase (GGDEF)-like protein
MYLKLLQSFPGHTCRPRRFTGGLFVRTRLAKFFISDSVRIVSLVLVVILLAIGGAKLNRMLAENLLEADAESESSAWAKSLADSANDLPAITTGTAPTMKTIELFQQASAVGGIYRYMIWDSNAKLVYIVNTTHFIGPQPTLASHHDPLVAETIHAGSILTIASIGVPPANPVHFAKSYVPIRENGVLIGIFEIHMDKTSDYEMYQRFLFLSESIFTVMLLFAAAVPGFMFYRKMLEHRRAQAEALFLAEHDSLTGLPSRKRLAEAAKGLLALGARNGTYTAALLIDLDRFKDINDTYGHTVGDGLIEAFAKRLSTSIRTEDIVARLGGDEFVILQVGMDQPSGASHLAERLVDILDKPYEVEGLHIRFGGSIGIAIAPTDATEWDQLLTCAYAALHKAKHNEVGHATCFFEAGMDAIDRERRLLKIEMQRALDENVFQLAYQPIVNFEDGSLLGFEALLRWPAGWGTKPPDVFIPVAEESGLIIPMGAWVLETACRTAAAWTKPLKISVNLSSVQFLQGDIVATVEKALEASGLSPKQLELEVTESLWLQNTDAVMDQLVRFRAMGISIALDDFGTGYSSLSYLWKFPFDTVKIDRSFVTQMGIDPKATAIIHTIVALGRTLNLKVTAEGVETPEQAESLKETGCDYAQGYWFGRPLTVDVANELAKSTATKRAS